MEIEKKYALIFSVCSEMFFSTAHFVNIKTIEISPLNWFLSKCLMNFDRPLFKEYELLPSGHQFRIIDEKNVSRFFLFFFLVAMKLINSLSVI